MVNIVSYYDQLNKQTANATFSTHSVMMFDPMAYSIFTLGDLFFLSIYFWSEMDKNPSKNCASSVLFPFKITEKCWQM